METTLSVKHLSPQENEFKGLTTEQCRVSFINLFALHSSNRYHLIFKLNVVVVSTCRQAQGASANFLAWTWSAVSIDLSLLASQLLGCKWYNARNPRKTKLAQHAKVGVTMVPNLVVCWSQIRDCNDYHPRKCYQSQLAASPGLKMRPQEQVSLLVAS